MKKPYLYILICTSLILLASASIWEGMAAAASGPEFPEPGFYIATNSFPLNSVVDVTNLENGRVVKARVSSAFDNPGLLALLSPDTASAVGLALRSVARVSLSQSSPVDSVNMNPLDLLANSRLTESRFSSGDPDFDPAAFASLNAYNPYLPGNSMYAAGNAGNERMEGFDLIIDLPDNTIPAISDESIIPVITPNYSSLNFVPTDTRPPEIIMTPDPSMIIPGISPAPFYPVEDNSIAYIDPGYIIEPIKQAPVPAEINPPLFDPVNIYPVIPPVDTPSVSTNFPLPMITFLESGMSYIQIGAYSKIETVLPELKKLEGIYPIAVMNAGNENNPLYRLLIGPITPGESGALLERFKTNYADAFIRTGK